ncbi:pectin lyase-like protein [Fragilariopsis cylindrus CCMP1102]|uniref:Pectin lyase-like protein n=1 Tax=Fragilariopsis cylindrus CCMP1102 TaxID=635003 RepID=A0A1E7FVN3_9STRA|nr:pectin lyase-like protein [Fragilariopsis cylindrus CCMP1102]|eukprot:OEU22184.1 pectin lyase-like protein [Fragilariopsis cylindrus CCMP1102]
MSRVMTPRSVGNTDGLDPDSCENVLIDSCYIDTGDDGISIKEFTYIVSRNWCIGSATFCGIYDILFEDSTIGDPYTVTSPWAIKFKSHLYYPGPMENITIRCIVMGKIGPTPWMYPNQPGSVLLLGLSYGNGPPSKGRSGKPILKNVTFEDITAMSAGVAGKIQGVPEDCLQGLTLRNISVLDGEANWRCNHIDLSTLTISNVYPPVSCSGECTTCKSSTSTSTSNTTLVDGNLTATRSG